jgi:cytochrome c oxidase subunit 2
MRRTLLQTLTAGLVLATASGCTYTWEDFPRLGMPTPVTEGVGLILWPAFFHRRTRTKVEVPPQTRYNMPIEALYTVVPLIVVSVLFYFTARDEAELLELSEEPAHTIGVVGFQWSWGFNYVENVDGRTATGDAKADPDLAIVPDRYGRAFPTGAEGVYDAGTPATRNPQPAERQPRPDTVAAQGREGPLHPVVP